MDYTYTSILPLVVLWIIATLSGYIAWFAYTVCVYDLPSRIAASIGGIASLLMSALPIIDFIRKQSDLKEWACVTLGIGLAGIWFPALIILSKVLLTRWDRSFRE